MRACLLVIGPIALALVSALCARSAAQEPLPRPPELVPVAQDSRPLPAESAPAPAPAPAVPAESAPAPAVSDPPASDPPPASKVAASGGAPHVVGAPASNGAPTAAPRAALPRYEPRYHSPEQAIALLRAWSAGREGVDVELELAWRTRAGLPVPFLTLGKSGPLPLRERPTLVLVGALDGLSRSGSEAVLAIVDALLERPQALPDGIAVLAAPLASPEALQRAFDERKRGLPQGGNSVLVDEDGDLVADEDAPDDLDGDGAVLWMLIEEPRGPLVRGADPRFLVPARPGDGPRYRLVREGRDDDADGAFNEDGPGGVVLDRNFPVGWSGPRRDPLGGTTPLSEPEAVALAEQLLARKVYAALVFQGHHGGVVLPGAGDPARRAPSLPLPADLPAFERLARTAAERLGRSTAPLRAWQVRDSAAGAGAFADWAYTVAGALALEIAPWGPDVESRAAPRARNEAELVSGPGALLVNDAQWVRWLDDERGGIGFCDWHPVELESGARVLVGGWEPETVDNPPEESLTRAVAGCDALAIEFLKAAPTLEVEFEAVERRGELVRLVARARNRGLVPTGLGPEARLALKLELPSDARLVSGATEQLLDSLPGYGASPRVEWWVAAPAGAPLAVSAEDKLVRRVRVEVRP
ncbi:MAG: hypothetical protein EPO68_03450 [Planctomycetota bacterium]|nr:MAG: hypothetical protein EPO68_03450 [Planctomycetota bacterium]